MLFSCLAGGLLRTVLNFPLSFSSCISFFVSHGTGVSTRDLICSRVHRNGMGGMGPIARCPVWFDWGCMECHGGVLHEDQDARFISQDCKTLDSLLDGSCDLHCHVLSGQVPEGNLLLCICHHSSSISLICHS